MNLQEVLNKIRALKEHQSTEIDLGLLRLKAKRYIRVVDVTYKGRTVFTYDVIKGEFLYINEPLFKRFFKESNPHKYYHY